MSSIPTNASLCPGHRPPSRHLRKSRTSFTLRHLRKSRPDAVIWSCKSRTVVLLELTCCAEEGQEAAQLRKENRYFKLLNDSKEQGWRAELLTIEIGARGLIGNSTWRAFVKLGLSSQEATALCRRLSEVVARCSLAICQAQNIKEWTHKELIGPLSPA